MTEILSDAEYRLLPESEKTRYWRTRYEEAAENWHAVSEANHLYRRILKAIENSVEQGKQVSEDLL